MTLQRDFRSCIHWHDFLGKLRVHPWARNESKMWYISSSSVTIIHTPWWKYDGWKRAKCPHKSKCAGLLIVICCTHRLTVIFKLPVKLRNCFGNPDRGRAQSRVPEPSQRITGLAASMFTFRVWFSQKLIISSIEIEIFRNHFQIFFKYFLRKILILLP